MGNPLRRNLDGFTGFGVTTHSCVSFLGTKAAKASEFDFISRLQSSDNTIQDFLDKDFGLALIEIRTISDFIS